MIASLLTKIATDHPHEPEFLQAVTEIMESLEDFLANNPKYTEQKLLERLVEPERIITFRVARLDDQNTVQINTGYRVQFNSAIWPYKGGLRFHPSVNLSILKFLWFEQIFKNSLTGLPMGWGKWGSNFDPKGKSDNEIMRFCQAFMSELYRHISADTDVPAGDIGVGGREIGFLFGMYKKLRNEYTGVLTGKWLPFWGSLIRTEATGYGVVYFLQEILATKNETLAGKRLIVSGSGNVAQYAVEKAMQLGATVISVSDSDGTIEVAQWFTPELLAELLDLKNVRRGRLEERNKKPWITYHPNKTPRHLTAEVVLPCATQNELTLDDAKTLVQNWVRYVVEWANMPTTLEATTYLQTHNVIFAPGKAANAGWVATSWLEMSQNSLRLSRTREEVDEKLRQIMKNIHSTCVAYGREGNSINYVKGANIWWFVKVAEAMLAQGVV